MRRFVLAAVIVAGIAGCDRTEPARDKVAGLPDAAVPDAKPEATIRTPSNEASLSDYTQLAAASDMFEIESARIAQRRSTNPGVKAFAVMMITAHEKAQEDLKKALTTSHESLPTTALPTNIRVRLAALDKATAADFDRLYMDSQLEGHQDALDLHSRYANVGDIPALKAFAMRMAPIAQQHLDRARSVRNGLG